MCGHEPRNADSFEKFEKARKLMEHILSDTDFSPVQPILDFWFPELQEN